MEKDKRLSRRDFMKIAPLLGAGIAVACTRRDIPITELNLSPTDKPKQTQTAHPVDIPETLKNNPNTPEPTKIEPTPTEEIHSKEPVLGPIYLGNPFKIDVPLEVSKLGGFGSERKIQINEPLVIQSPGLTSYQEGVLKDYGNHPNAAIVARTDNQKVPNHWLIAAHSGFNFNYLPFDVFRRIYLSNPKSIVGKSISINQDSQKAKIELVHATHVPAQVFENSFVTYDDASPAFFWLDRLGIPYIEGNTDLVTFAACLNTLPDDVKIDKEGNPVLNAVGDFLGAPFSITYNRVLLTGKYVKA